MKQLHKSNWAAGDTLYETIMEADDDGYVIQQAAPSGHFGDSEETVFLDKIQAIMLARAILKNEGMTCD